MTKEELNKGFQQLLSRQRGLIVIAAIATALLIIDAFKPLALPEGLHTALFFVTIVGFIHNRWTFHRLMKIAKASRTGS